MTSRRPTIQSLISARNETDDSADERHRRYQQEQQYQHVNPKQLTRPVMNEDGESKARGPDDGGVNGNGHGKGEGMKGPKRGARACTNCRKGKNRCEGDGPACRRCIQHGLNCVFEKPTAKQSSNPLQGNPDSEGRINYIENHVSSLAATQSQMQQTLSQILSALAPGGIPAPNIPHQHTQQHVPPPFLHQPLSNGPHGNNNGSSAISSGYPLSAPPIGSNQGGYGYNPTGPGLAPPSLDRMDAFSPGTVAVLNEVAHHGMPTSTGTDNGRRGMSTHHYRQHQQQSPMGASMSSVSTGPPSHQQGHHHSGSVIEMDFAKSEPGNMSSFPSHMMSVGHSSSHLPPIGSMHHRPGSESSPSTMNDGTGPPPGVSHVRTSSFGWPEVSGRQMGSIDVNMGGGSVNVSGNGSNLIRRREDSAENDSQDEDSAALRPRPKKYPKLPGFKPPPHRYAQYGLVVPSTAASSEDESEDTLPRSSLNAPIEALQALANAADQAAAQESAAAGMVVDAQGASDMGAAVGEGFLSPPRVLQKQLRFKKRQKAEPTPRNAFPDVITKGLVSEAECRQLWDIFFSGCHLFIPLFDRSYDVFESFVVRTPFSFDGIMAVAAKIRSGNGPLDQTHHRALEEAQGIARSTLFGPVVRKEAVMAVLILAAWSQNGWLPSGHALRMGLDMHLHKALEKLNDNKSLAGQTRSSSEERDLIVSARIWLNCYLNDHMLSLGTGRPLMLKDDESVRGARILLNHPMESETDVRLIACVELMNHKVRVWETLHPLRGRIDSAAIDFVRRVNKDLLLWHEDWRGTHVEKLGQTHVLLDLLDAELYYAQLWCACVALRGCHWEKLSLDQRELAFQAKDAALKCLATYKSPTLRAYIKYAVHETMVQCSFAAVFLLKIAILFPTELPANVISLQVAELAHLLSECSAERYALTLRLMLRSFRRKMGENTMAPGTPRNGLGSSTPFGGNGLSAMTALNSAGVQSLLSSAMGGEGGGGDGNFVNAAELNAWMDDLGPFNWPEDGFSPSNLPPWIMDSNVTDLGLPFEGSDSIFLPPELADLFLGTGHTNWQLGDSAEQGAEAW